MRSRRGRAFGFRTISQLAIHYRHSPLSARDRDARRRGRKTGDRLPDAPITQRCQVKTLHAALAAPAFHLLLCGPAGHWPQATYSELTDRYASVLKVHHLTRDNIPDTLHDHTGSATHRLGLSAALAAHYLIRPDGHIATRGADRAASASAALDRGDPASIPGVVGREGLSAVT